MPKIFNTLCGQNGEAFSTRQELKDIYSYYCVSTGQC